MYFAMLSFMQLLCPLLCIATPFVLEPCVFLYGLVRTALRQFGHGTIVHFIGHASAQQKARQ